MADPTLSRQLLFSPCPKVGARWGTEGFWLPKNCWICSEEFKRSSTMLLVYSLEGLTRSDTRTVLFYNEGKHLQDNLRIVEFPAS